jgi:hypothetical protein
MRKQPKCKYCMKLGFVYWSQIGGHDSNICDHLGKGIANEGIANKT